MKNEEYVLDGTSTYSEVEESSVLRKHTFDILYFIVKRLFDIVCGFIGCLFLIPVAFVIKICYICTGDFASIFFTQKRIGKDGVEFNFYKFRSMVPNADAILMEMLKDPVIEEEYKKNMKLKHDPRITKIGKFIRKFSIDELPQVINVLNNTMSIIGNRPYLPREKEDIGGYYHDIIKSKPGITGYWQVSGRSDIEFKDRCKLESYYSNHMSLGLDLKIFFRTFKVVLFGKGAE